MKLKEKKSGRTLPKEDFRIAKDGTVIRKDKRLSKAYERKYSHKVLETYRVDKQGKVRTAKGHFTTTKLGEKYKELKGIALERKDKKSLLVKESRPSRKIKGRFMSKNYAHMFECTCYIEEGITTHEDDKTGRTLTHYYTISADEQITLGQAEKRHDRHYPTHTLLNIRHASTKVLSFD